MSLAPLERRNMAPLAAAPPPPLPFTSENYGPGQRRGGGGGMSVGGGGVGRMQAKHETPHVLHSTALYNKWRSGQTLGCLFRSFSVFPQLLHGLQFWLLSMCVCVCGVEYCLRSRCKPADEVATVATVVFGLSCKTL